MKYSVVIPVYNTVKTLPLLTNRLTKVFEETMGVDYEIIFVEDCSPNPKSWEKLQEIAREYKKVTAIKLTRNFGQQAATLCGIRESDGDFVITMDDDLQHHPEDIPHLAACNSHDIVIGQFKQKKHSLFKRVMSKMKGYFDHIIIGKPKHIQLSPYRMINRTTIDGMLQIQTPNPFIPALMFYVSKDVHAVMIGHHEREEGQGNYSFKKLVGVFKNLLIGNSSFLLKMIGYFGILISSVSIFYASYILIRQLTSPTIVTGWTSVIVSVLFIGGLLLFAVGVLGEYLIRIISGVEKKPTYIIRTKIKD